MNSICAEGLRAYSDRRIYSQPAASEDIRVCRWIGLLAGSLAVQVESVVSVQRGSMNSRHSSTGSDTSQTYIE